jgi:chemotaxis methyl-accepting protein methylase
MSEKTKKHQERIQEYYANQAQSVVKSAGLIVASNLADITPPGKLPAKIIRYIKFSDLSEATLDLLDTEQRNTHGIQQVLLWLLAQSGHDFTSYKKSTIASRINRRLAFHKHISYTEYADYLQHNPAETDTLFNELLIGVTKFFRDAQAFEALKIKLTGLLKTKKDNEPIRIWVSGCSTGQEAYSIAMLITECLEKLKMNLKVQIFATDLSASAIEYARHGIYYDNAVADLSERRIRKFFIRQDDVYQVTKELRNMITFSRHNLIKDAPFTRLDLLCCRNVMIYFTAELQKKIVPILHYALNTGGLIFTGMAENISGLAELFVPVDEKWKIFERNCNDTPNLNPAAVVVSKQKSGITKAPAQLQYNHIKYLQEKFADTQQQLIMTIKQMQSLLVEINLINKSPQVPNINTTLNIPNYPTPQEIEQLNSNIKGLLDATAKDILLLNKQLEDLRFERKKVFTAG